MAPQNVRVYGYTSYNRPASPPLLILSVLVDLCIFFGISTLVLRLFRISPTPSLGVALLIVSMGVAYWVLQRITAGVTLGERTWWLRTRKDPDHWLKRISFQCDYFAPSYIFTSCLLTTLAVLISSATIYRTILGHPLWLHASHRKLDALDPSTFPQANEHWLSASFYYGLGSWPKVFAGKPVFYTLPYESGPPTRFVGRIQANLDSPDIKLIFEGPKTPAEWESQTNTRDCFLNLSSYHCLQVREETLSRHIKEIQPLFPYSWDLEWFTVNPANASEQEVTQGIHLKAIGSNWIQDRFILINSHGTHQTLILKRSKNAKGALAFDLVEQSLRTLRMFKDLESVRTWTNQELEKARVGSLNASRDTQELATNFIHLQTLLLAKISVDPANFDSYFHLAGTSALMLRKLATLIPDKSQIALRSPEILAAVQNIDSAYHFSRDVSPRDTRLPQLQSLWLESKKWR